MFNRLFKRTQTKHKFASSNGQSLVEFALTLPVLLLIMVGILDLGRYAFAAMTVINAAREGARYGAANPCSGSCANITARARSEATGSNINPTQLTPVTTSMPSGCALGNPIVVTVSYNFQFLTAYFFGSGVMPITASDRMPIFGACP